MALIEGAKGVLVLAAGLGLFALVHRDIQALSEELVNHLHLNPARRFPRIFLHLAANVSDRRLWGLAAAAIVYSLMQLVEAWGLWRGWQWTKWFAVVSGGIYLPIEVHGVFHLFTWPRLIVLGFNTLVVAYLFSHVVFKPSTNIRKRRPIGTASKIRHLRGNARDCESPPHRPDPCLSPSESER